MADDAHDAPVVPSRRSLLAVAVLWTTVMVSVSLAAGCYGHNCDGDTAFYGTNTGEGHLVDANTWESTPVDGTWLDFRRQRVWIFDLQALGADRVPYEYVPYVSADPNPVQTGNFTIAAGNLAEESGVGKGRLVIKNDTCADYYLRVVVSAAPRTSTAPTPATPSAANDGGADAGSDADSGP